GRDEADRCERVGDVVRLGPVPGPGRLELVVEEPQAELVAPVAAGRLGEERAAETGREERQLDAAEGAYEEVLAGAAVLVDLPAEQEHPGQRAPVWPARA